MKIHQTPEITSKLTSYREIAQLNSALSQALLQANNGPVDDNPYQIEEYAKTFQQNLTMSGEICTPEEALIGGMVSMLYYQIGAWEYIDSRILSPLLKQSQVFTPEFLTKNPYLKNIKLSNTKLGPCQLASLAYSKYELFPYEEAKLVPPFLSIPSLATCTSDFSLPCILKDGKLLTALTPLAAFALEKYIKAAVGKVVILGAELGYLAYRVAQKENVESITIVEADKDLIALFKQEILPQFGEYRKKIKILPGEALEFMNNLPDGKYDYALINIWQNPGDTLPYLQLKQATKHFQLTPIAYCYEDSLVEALMGYVYMLCCQGLGDSKELASFTKVDDKAEKVFAQLEKLFADIEIYKLEEIDYFLNKQHLVELLAK